MQRRPHLASNIVEGVELFEKLQRKLSSGDEDASSHNHHVSLDDPSAASPSRHALIEPHDARFTAWLGFDSSAVIGARSRMARCRCVCSLSWLSLTATGLQFIG